jgi:hypothetical protein
MPALEFKAIIIHGKGIFVGLLILCSFELYLHNDDFLERYRSVFAVGRAADKINFVAKTQPTMVVMGNSRVDNGINPGVIASSLHLNRGEVFNLGIPGQNTRVLSGVMKILARKKALVSNRLRFVAIGIDETLFTPEDNLNYSVFFADRLDALFFHEPVVLLGSVFRMWGYSDNLKGLREPGRMRDFLIATIADREPWGGSVSSNLGYRAMESTLNAQQANSTFIASKYPTLEPSSVAYFFKAIDELLKNNIKVGVFFTPQYRRSNPFASAREDDEYQGILRRLRKHGVEIFITPKTTDYSAVVFSDPGHLNKTGAEKFSRELSAVIQQRWPELGEQL